MKTSKETTEHQDVDARNLSMPASDFEAALRGLLQTPPPPKRPVKKRKKKE